MKLGPSDEQVPLIGRSPALDENLYLIRCEGPVPCRGPGCVEEVGRRAIGDKQWLIAGLSTYYRLSLGAAPDRIEVAVDSPPTGRVNLLSSLSAGRLYSKNRRIPLYPCDSGGTSRLLLRGHTDESQIPAGREPRQDLFAPSTSQAVEVLPLPRWAARSSPEVQEGSLAISLAEFCVEPDQALRVLPLGAAALAGGEPLPGAVPPGGTIAVGGHRLRYSTGFPLAEQALALSGFLALAVIGVGLTVRRCEAGVGLDPNAHKFSWTALGLLCLLTLIAIGAGVQMHQSASEDLLGSADYIQRHLLTGYLAVAALYASVDLSLRWREEGMAERFLRVLRIFLLTLLGLSAWLLVDKLLWRIVRPPDLLVNEIVLRQQWVNIAGLVALSSLLTGLERLLRHGWVQRQIRPLSGSIWRAVDDLLAASRALVARMGGRFEGYRIAEVLLVRPGASQGAGLGGLVAGLIVLGLGIPFWETGRSVFGFDLKPAEFAPMLLGLGWAEILTRFSTESYEGGSRSGRLLIPALRASVWFSVVFAAVILLYAGLGDLGPLMVITPALLISLLPWAWDWIGTKSEDRHMFYPRFALFSLAGVVLWVGAWLFIQLAIYGKEQFTEAPLVGASIERSIERFQTLSAPWYTRSGEWSTGALWRAAGFYGEGVERYLSNLHSDLAYLAILQSHGIPGAFAVLMLFACLIFSLLRVGEGSLVDAATLVRMSRERKDHDLASHIARTGFFCYFAASYLLVEVVVHIGTCFNTLPQTGITLPWLSSGGSAAVGFAILVGTAFGFHVAHRRSYEQRVEALEVEGARHAF